MTYNADLAIILITSVYKLEPVYDTNINLAKG